MKLIELKLTNFRNYPEMTKELPSGVTVIVGRNAIGKTNFLEGIRLLSFGKSFRVRRERDLVKWGEEFYRVEGGFKLDSEKKKISLALDMRGGNRMKKMLKLDDVPVKGVELLGKFLTVLFAPEDLQLIVASPGQRRKYMDMVLAQVSRKYCVSLAEIKEILLQRNNLIWQIAERQRDVDELDFWNDKLIEVSRIITKERDVMIRYFNKHLSIKYSEIAGRDEVAKLRYKSSFDLGRSFSSQMEGISGKEFERKKTLIGPQLDDFEFRLRGENLSNFGSRGEFRTMILALKSVEVDFLEENMKMRPVLLLDDVFSELDEKRRGKLYELAKRQQTVITTTERDFLEDRFLKKKDCHVLDLEKIKNKKQRNDS